MFLRENREKWGGEQVEEEQVRCPLVYSPGAHIWGWSRAGARSWECRQVSREGGTLLDHHTSSQGVLQQEAGTASGAWSRTRSLWYVMGVSSPASLLLGQTPTPTCNSLITQNFEEKISHAYCWERGILLAKPLSSCLGQMSLLGWWSCPESISAFTCLWLPMYYLNKFSMHLPDFLIL